MFRVAFAIEHRGFGSTASIVNLSVAGVNETVRPFEWSRHVVFRAVTDHVWAALRKFRSNGSNPTPLEALLTWLNHYSTLFYKRCRKCQRFLSCDGGNVIPPVIREYGSGNALHPICRTFDDK